MSISSLKTGVVSPSSLLAGNTAYSPYFIESITTSAGDQQANAITMYDSNLYVTGNDAQGGALFQKITTGASVSVSKYLSNGFSLGVGKIATDGAGNFYLGNTSGANSATLVKIDSTGAIQAQKQYGGLYATMGLFWDATNSVGYLPIYPSSGGKGALLKIDSSLAISWQKEFSTTGGAADDQYIYSVVLDSSNNPYGFGYAYGATENLIVKMTTAGAITWQITNTGATPIAGAIDSSDNIYVLGFSGPTLFKYNSTPTQQWSRRLTHSGTLRSANNSLVIGADGYLYYIGYYATGGTAAEGGFIVKYNSSGTIQWQRTIKSAADNIRLQGIVIDGSTMYVTGKIATNGGDVFLAALPTDGSLTGTYSLGGTNIVYAAGSFTEADYGGSSSTQNTTIGNSSYTATTPTYTATTSTATVTKVQV
jgi:hypothetical protein